MKKKGYILVNFEQFEDETPYTADAFELFWNAKIPRALRVGTASRKSLK